MLKPVNRLGKNVIEKPKIFQTPFVTIKIAKNNEVHNRYGFVVSKQISKKAVERNRVKRKTRACIEQTLLQIKPGYDMLFIIKKESRNTKQEALCQAIHAVLQRNAFITK